jgi:hypothetical protein
MSGNDAFVGFLLTIMMLCLWQWYQDDRAAKKAEAGSLHPECRKGYASSVARGIVYPIQDRRVHLYNNTCLYCAKPLTPEVQ